MSMPRLTVVVLLFAVLAASSTFGQNQLASNPQATAYAAQSIAALTRGKTIRDVTLSANVVWIPGAEPETGSGVLLAKGASESRVDVALSGGGNRTEIRSGNNGPAGRWVNPDGRSGKYASHNCMTDAAWFFPGLSSLAHFGDPRFVFSYVGDETWKGLSTKHLRVYQVHQGSKQAQRLSTTDFYLDAGSLLPLGIAFNVHPDGNMNVDILSEVRFADYRLVNGIEVPFRIQRLQSGAPLMDVTVTAASFNTGTPENAFEIH